MAPLGFLEDMWEAGCVHCNFGSPMAAQGSPCDAVNHYAFLCPAAVSVPGCAHTVL